MAVSQNAAMNSPQSDPAATAASKQSAPTSENARMLRTAFLAGGVTFLLTSLIVGIQTVSSTGQLDFTTRFKEVIISAVGVFIGSIVITQMRAGRPLVGVIVAGGISAVLFLILVSQGHDTAQSWLVPFQSMIVNW